jgi:3-oxoadipate enol-lactonase
MGEVHSADGVRLHAEVDGDGEPVTVFAHGLTNSCMELAAFTPMAPGTKVRFCFRGHGHSEVPEAGHYRFSDYAADLDAVGDAYGATRAVGTSLGAGAILHLVAEEPDRFERLVLLLPAALDEPVVGHPMSMRTADLLEALPKDRAIEQILEESGRARNYETAPGLREFDMLLWQDMNPVGVARAIREVVGDRPVQHRGQLSRVEAPALIICREGDSIHPAALARSMAEIMPHAELVELASEEDLLTSIPMLIDRVSRFLA